MLSPTLNKVKSERLHGEFGIEMEGLRVEPSGFLAHTPHPFGKHAHIERDFSENQIEINTGVEKSATAAVKALGGYYRKIQKVLRELPAPEYLWPFSNPPYIRNEEDIPIARFSGEELAKTTYREYLSDRYGRYKMTFSGIHVNYSFSEKFLREQYEKSGEDNYIEYKNQLYIQLAEKMLAYSWLLVAVTAASPLADISFVEKGSCKEDVFLGLASIRCSELGYWNFFTPVLSYENLASYISSLESYIEKRWIQAPSELYYPVRVKPKGKNTLENLKKSGINHIELRMFDLNPLTEFGIEERDVEFVQLLLGWLVSLPKLDLEEKDQIQAIQNMKHAAHYDLKTVKIGMPDGKAVFAVEAALEVLQQMKNFYKDFAEHEDIFKVLTFEEEKFLDPSKRYAWQVRTRYGQGYVEKGLALAARKQVSTDV